MISKLRIASLCLLLGASTLSANIGGTVYRDYNINAVQDGLEPGLEGIVVNAYDTTGVVAATATTDAAGAFDIATGTGKYRVEVVTPNYLYDTADGASTTAKPATFASEDGETGITIGLHNPGDYTSENTKVIAVTYAAGSLDKAKENASLRLFDYKPNNGNNTDSAAISAKVGEIGTTWGLAYDPTSEKAYTSAMLRRHAAVGPNGLGAIYTTDFSDPDNPVTSLFTTVNNPGTEPANRNLGNPNDPNHDPDTFAKVANVGMGDLDVSEDGKTLYMINLNTQELVEIDIASKVEITHPITNPFGANCLDANVRSWAVEPHDGAVYVGSVCSSDPAVGAAVSKWENGAFSTLFTVSLTYEREGTLFNSADSNAGWKPWTDSLMNGQFDVDPRGSHRFQDAKIAQPILSDIVFTEESGMVLGFSDRTSFQTGQKQWKPDAADETHTYEYDAGGDTLRVCKTDSGYVLEGKAGCATHTNEHNINEYFIGDSYRKSDSDNNTHDETTLGGLLHKQGTSEIGTSAYDMVNEKGSGGYNRSGVSFLSLESGKQLGGQLLNGAGTVTGSKAGFAKSGGMGDLELMTEAAPIEIGNYVWFDKDGDGIQDPDEEPIAGVEVKLYDGDILVGTATTDADGHYYFGGPSDTNGHVNSNTDYQLRIDLADAALDGKAVTTIDAGGNDAADSDGDDGTLNAGFSTIVYTTGSAGQNNHDLDFGFKSLVPKIDIEKATNGIDADTVAEAVELSENEAVTWSYVVTNTGEEPLKEISVNDDKEGAVTCPKTELAVGESMTCTAKTGVANVSNYENRATVQGKGKTSNQDVDDVDPSHYKTTEEPESDPTYHIGTHFWIDEDKDSLFDSNEKPIDGALVELFDENGNKLRETHTANGGEYGFDVPAGSYYVVFHIPNTPEYEGYVFSDPKNNSNNNTHINKANQRGITQSVTVGPNSKTQDLTLDAGINCGCSGVSGDSGDALSIFGMLGMMFMTLFAGLLFVKEEEQHA